MAIPYPVKRGILAALLLVAFVLQGTISVLAGTTGSISGVVVDPANNAPVAGAHVTATSPSQSATTTTDQSGRFTFASLAPDTYTLSVAAAGNRDAASISGVTVQADQNLNVTLSQPVHLQNIGRVASRSAANLVKPGTTADVYSVTAVQQDKSAALGGGGTLNSAWSAISSVPGVFVAPNQNGYIGAGPTLSIRGGDYDQIGYELDGVPVNRSFDNYPSGVLSSLGQQEVQVYTGAAPAGAEADAISGYINQVIRTGTAPATNSLDLSVATPILYNRVAFEAGGANPSRTFSYYLGTGAYNQAFRYYDESNGASLDRLYGTPLAPCWQGGTAPVADNSCFTPGGTPYAPGPATAGYAGPLALGPFNAFSQAYEQVRDTVANFHFGIPQRSGNKDDVQLLWDYEHIGNYGYDSPNDQGGYPFLNAIGAAPIWLDTYTTTMPYGTLLPQTYTGGGVAQYPFPFSPQGRPLTNLGAGTVVSEPANNRDEYVNDQSIIKAQYQHNFGTSAFLRAYVYTYYSDWLNYGPNSTVSDFLAFDSPDYELNSHTRGGSLQFTDQLASQHLLSFNASYTTANSIRYNNSFYGNGAGTAVGYLVNGNDPASGICYGTGGAAVPGCAVNPGCAPGPGAANCFTEYEALTGGVTPATGTCGTGPCQYLVVNGGPSASYNTVVPRFTTLSLSDVWTPTDKLNINLGMRFDQFQFIGSSTNDTIARTLFFNAYDLTHPTSPLFNIGNNVDTFDEWQPRLGATYTVNPSTVVRLSYGRYAEAPNTAFEQYNYLQPNSLGPLKSFNSLGLGNTPGHDVRPEVSNNYDMSLEHQFGSDVSIKLSPFFRSTQDQIQQFYLDQKTSFVSGLNVGHQTSKGVEFELDKGDFSRNGIAARLSFTYTNSQIKYDLAPNGTSVVTGINQLIAGYNAYTKAGGGSPCYTPVAPDGTPGTGTACAPGMVANPYYNANPQPLLSQNASYPTFDLFPAGIESEYGTYGAPYVGTFIVQWKHGPLAITPALQVAAGERYGAPINTPGVDPASCGVLTGGSTTGDPRYPYGAAGGTPYDATTCVNQIAIPNIYTHSFDTLGGYVAPTALQLHLQATYDLSKRVTIVANFVNIVNTCFGGSKTPWSVNNACLYNVAEGAPVVEPYGNFYNPGDALQPVLTSPYWPYFNQQPFNMYVEARIKL